MPAPLLAIFASLSWGLADFLGGFTARRMSVLAVLAASQPVGLVPILGVFLWRGGNLHSGFSWAWAVAAGTASVFSLGMLYLAMSRGRMVLVAPLAATGVSLPVLIGLLSGDPVTPVLLLGIALAVAGTLAVTLGGESESDQKTSVTGQRDGRRSDIVAALFALGSAIGQGSFLTLLDRASGNANAFSATVVMRVTSTALAILLFLGYVIRRRVMSTDRTASRPSSGPLTGGSRSESDASAEHRPLPVQQFGVHRDKEQSFLALASPDERWEAERLPGQSGDLQALPQHQMSRALITLAAAVAGAGITDGLAEIAFASASASSRGHLSVVAVLSEQYPTITMFLALALLRERAILRQYIGALGALSGVLLLSIG